MATVYYSDPMFDELYSRIPEESRRISSHSFAIAAHINEILERKGWSKTDFAVAMGKKNAEISKWMSGQHNFTIATIAKIESVLGEDIIVVKKYRKPIAKYDQMPESKRQFVSDVKTKYISKKKDSSND